LVVSLIAFSAMVPVKLRSMGIFDFQMDANRRKQISLGASQIKFPRSPLNSIEPVIQGLALPTKYSTAIHFVWQALNSELALYRFINLTIAIELLVRHDSPVIGSRHPRCGKCDYELRECPECARTWKIPSQLRQRAAFLIPDETISGFINARNLVFHGLSDDLNRDTPENLPQLNMALLLLLRNYLGKQMGIPDVRPEELSIVLNPPTALPTVFYSPPKPDHN
jgi:hypothetical protein